MNAYPASLPTYIDSSMMVQFRACPKKFFWEYCLSLRPRGRKIDLVAGGAFAAALEAAYIARYVSNMDDFHCYREALRAFYKEWGDFPPNPEVGSRSAKSFDRVFGAVLDYFETYPFNTDHVRPLLRSDGKPAFEFTFSIPLDDPSFPRHPETKEPFLYQGRFDAFGHIDEMLVIRDEKTTGMAPNSRWSERWTLRNQFMGYVAAAQRCGFPVNTVVVRGITIQKTQYHHVEAIKLYPPDLIQKFWKQLSLDLHRIVQSYEAGYFDYDFGDACTSFNSPCAYMDLCYDTQPERWFGDYDRERWDPLERKNIPLDEPTAHLEAA